MELQDKPLDPQESLKLIQQFIAGTRNNIRKSAFGFIFWGILIAVAALLNYFLTWVTSPEKAGLAWPVLTIGGFVTTIIYYSVNTRKDGAVSAFGFFFKWLFLCGGITYFLLIFICVELKVSPTPFMLALSALLITVSGLVLRFKPLFWGGILFFLTTIVSVFISPMSQLLLVGGSFLLGYLLPGILLVRKRNEEC
ncbi:MAG TPA: hypothetical protein VIU45_01595 [Chitinophagaceae bacterium]